MSSNSPRDQFGRRIRRSPERTRRRQSSPKTNARYSPSPRRRRSPSHRSNRNERRPTSPRRHRSPPRQNRSRSPTLRTSKATYDDRFGRKAVAAEKEQHEKEKEEQAAIDKETINLQPTGLLDIVDQDGHELNGGVRLQYHEPHDAALSSQFWRLYVFKDGSALDTLHLHRKSCFRIGRERRVADIPLDHPSCSKQHAVIQFRRRTNRDVVGSLTQKVCPYVIDLGSTNGTFLNDDRLEPARFYELLEHDCLRFGQSSRQYIVLHADSKPIE